ncbi:hypothetical protein KVT40_008276 [Elsinoe batatas]|uniref:Cleft lip and palate transmembrane protein 1 n=1 Tax=Elsinoe batatas TaxID=2601811 RepID=A0A8K0KU16_9PEZI|nr:hypothetical protein KVT40_008276 [Elsinoe batatas]
MPEGQRQAPGQQEEPQTGWQSTLRSVVQMVGIWFFVQFVMKQFMPQPAQNNSTATSDFKTAQPPSVGTSYSAIPQTINPIWPSNVTLDVSMYISPSVVMPSLKNMPAESLVLREKGFRYGDFKDKRDASITFKVPKEVQNNGTLWAHIYVAQSGAVLDPTEAGYDPSKAYRMTRPLTQHLLKKKEKKVKNLLAGKNESDIVEQEPAQKGPTVANYYHPNFTAAFIPDTGSLKYPTMHPATRQFVQLEATGARDQTGQNGWYYPVLYMNTFWQLKSQMTILNDTVKELSMNVQLNNLANWKFNLMSSMDEGMKETARKNALGESTPGGGDGSEMELIKETLLDTSIYLLGTTAIVSVLHMIFEMLAFKNDVSHWRKKKDNVGTSFRTILANVIMQTIIFLYLLDQNENTSWMILASQGMGILVEAWKITKTVNVRVRESAPGSLIPYRVTFEDKHKLSETEKQTEEYDQIAFKYLYIAGVPLLVAYAIYSLYYESHKSWYSYVIQVLVGSVYAYGFLLMCPALYINYRLQSVAHMPGKAMMYKFLNTFIDDLFAFTIKMPWLYRLSVFRDDIIFFIYLYQSWKYRVDYKRVNEFGGGGDDEEPEEKKTTKPLAAPPGADEKSGTAKEAEGTTTSSSAGAGAKKRK